MMLWLTIKYCRRTGIPIRARGGAHCYQPASLVNFGIVLDQKPRDKVGVLDGHKCRVQAGALLGPTVNVLNEQGLLVPLGTCVTNGCSWLGVRWWYRVFS